MTRAHRAAVLVVALLLAAAIVLVVTGPSGPSGAEGTTSVDPPSTTTPATDASMRSLSAAIATRWEAMSTTTTTTHHHPRRTRPTAPRRVAASGDHFDALAQCESGGDPTTNTGNGFYGAFQFTLSTWHSIGRTGNPTDYSYGEQKAAAIDLQARSGWGQWPACSRRLGYR